MDSLTSESPRKPQSSEWLAIKLHLVLGPGALGRPRGIGWRGRREGGSGWGTHVNPWLIHVNVWQKPLQYCKVISLQLIKINEKKSCTCFSNIWYTTYIMKLFVFIIPLLLSLFSHFIMVLYVLVCRMGGAGCGWQVVFSSSMEFWPLETSLTLFTSQLSL